MLSEVMLDVKNSGSLKPVMSPLSLRRDSFISPGFKDFFSVVTLKFDFLPQK